MRKFRSVLFAAWPLLALVASEFASSERLFAQPAAAPSNEPVVPVTAHRTDLELIA